MLSHCLFHMKTFISFGFLYTWFPSLSNLNLSFGIWIDKHWVLEVPGGTPHLIVVLLLYVVCNVNQGSWKLGGILTHPISNISSLRGLSLLLNGMFPTYGVRLQLSLVLACLGGFFSPVSSSSFFIFWLSWQLGANFSLFMFTEATCGCFLWSVIHFWWMTVTFLFFYFEMLTIFNGQRLHCFYLTSPSPILLAVLCLCRPRFLGWVDPGHPEYLIMSLILMSFGVLLAAFVVSPFSCFFIAWLFPSGWNWMCGLSVTSFFWSRLAFSSMIDARLMFMAVSCSNSFASLICSLFSSLVMPSIWNRCNQSYCPAFSKLMLQNNVCFY